MIRNKKYILLEKQLAKTYKMHLLKKQSQGLGHPCEPGWYLNVLDIKNHVYRNLFGMYKYKLFI